MLSIDGLVRAAVDKRRDFTVHFWKSDVVNQVLRNPRLSSAMVGLRRPPFSEHDLESVVKRYVQSCVSKELSRENCDGIREFECYAAGEKERRWLPVRKMDIVALSALVSDTRHLERTIHIKGKRYDKVLAALKERGLRRFEDMYDDAVAILKAA